MAHAQSWCTLHLQQAFIWAVSSVATIRVTCWLRTWFSHTMPSKPWLPNSWPALYITNFTVLTCLLWLLSLVAAMVWNTSCFGNSHTSSVPYKEPVNNNNFSQPVQAGSQKLYAHAYTQYFSAPNSGEHISFLCYIHTEWPYVTAGIASIENQKMDCTSIVTDYIFFISLSTFNFYTGLFEMTVGVLTTCHTQYTWDRSICIFLFNRTTLQVLHSLQVLYMCTLCDSTNINTITEFVPNCM